MPRFADLPADDVAVLARAVEVVMARIDDAPASPPPAPLEPAGG
ncbi:hypothetical protein [Clavibacter zhangzhiyongii]